MTPPVPLPDGPPSGLPTVREKDAPPTVSDWALVLWIVVLSAATAVVGTAFLPLYVGAVPLPVSALLAPPVLWWAAQAAYRLTCSMSAAVLPAAVWLITAGWLSIARNGIVPGQPYAVHDGQWRVMLLLGIGAVSAAAALSLIWAERVRRQIAADRPGDRTSSGGSAPGSIPGG